MRTPTIVIVGRPNVGKSLLFNRLLGNKRALVHAKPGMTLDFLRERVVLPNDKTAWLVDTGGVGGEEDSWTPLAHEKMWQAAAGADLLLLVVDAVAGLMPGDVELAAILRCHAAPWLLVVNKAENQLPEIAVADFHALGGPRGIAVSAKQGGGLAALRATLAEHAADGGDGGDELSLVVVGRPNVGKSTFINRLLNERRLVVSERPGTTRDAVRCLLPHPQGDVHLIDTAGMRRKRADEEREKFGVAAARAALAAADAALLMFDLSVGVTRQDKRIAAMAEESGCALTVLGNKADLLSSPRSAGRVLKREMKNLLSSTSATAFPLSAVSRRQLPAENILAAVRRSALATRMNLPTPKINETLIRAVRHQPPRRVGLVRPKLRYAHQGGVAPLRIVIHGSAVGRIEESYRRYLAAAFADEFDIVGAPIKIVLRAEDNPYVKH